MSDAREMMMRHFEEVVKSLEVSCFKSADEYVEFRTKLLPDMIKRVRESSNTDTLGKLELLIKAVCSYASFADGDLDRQKRIKETEIRNKSIAAQAALQYRAAELERFRKGVQQEIKEIAWYMDEKEDENDSSTDENIPKEQQ